jgi:hypothetical protein
MFYKAGLLTRPSPGAFPSQVADYGLRTVAKIARFSKRTHSSGYCQRISHCSLFILNLRNLGANIGN